MRRLLLLLLNLLAFLSLLLAVATCVLWARSYSHLERRGRMAPTTTAAANLTVSYWEAGQSHGVAWLRVRR